MHNEKPQTIYEDDDLLVINKPSGINSDDFDKRVHRLDKDTSGILLIAKNDRTLQELQEEFQKRNVEKEYIALVVGHLKDNEGNIETLIGRSPKDRRKQRTYLETEPTSPGKRKAKTHYELIERLKDYDLLRIKPLTGRKHQIRAHLAYLGHPIAGDKLYGFKNQIAPKGLRRQFLHANSLKIKLNNKEIKFEAELPLDLKEALIALKENDYKN